jgi:hypothetical protein
MAAAQMHSEGRLIQVMDTKDFRQSDRIDDRRDLLPNDSRRAANLGESDPSPRRQAARGAAAKALGADALDAQLAGAK